MCTCRFVESANDPKTDPVVLWLVNIIHLLLAFLFKLVYVYSIIKLYTQQSADLSHPQ